MGWEYSVKIERLMRELRFGYGWTVRVLGDGTDKSNYHVVKVAHDPGFEGEECSLFRCPKRKFKRTFPVFRYRDQARMEKNKLPVRWVSNHNGYREQQAQEYRL